MPRYDQTVDWLYFIWKALDGTVLAIARRRGPDIQSLDHAGVWHDRPELLPRFQDGSYFDEATLDEARAAASRSGVAWPAPA